MLLVLCSSALIAQERTITGRVIDAAGKQPLAGVTVSIKNSNTTGTQTDDNGNFTLRAPIERFTLLASSIGYASIEVEVSPNNKEVIIRLSKNDAELGEVIIVGYSNKKRSELTSAVTVVSSEKLKDVTTNNIGNMLQGKVAGLQVVAASGVPGAAPEIRLRGISSVNASQSPLFVVDGVIGGNYDPNDVESVTVLKDAGATAMYGSQANAGVIIVTTKKAKPGKNRFEAKVTTGFRKADFGSMEMMNSNELYDYQKEFYRDYIPGESDNSYKIDLLKFYAERPLSLREQDYNWRNTIFSNAFMQNYYVSFAGRTEKSNYYTGVSYYNEKGTFKNTGFQRINLRANVTHNFAKWINVTNNINISASSGNSYDYMDIYYAYLNLPWDNPYDSIGRPRYVDGNSTFKWWSRDKINPVHTINNSDHPYKGFDVNYDFALNADITPWLSFSSSNRLAAGYNKSSNFFSPSVAGTYHGAGFLDELSTLNYGVVSNNLLKFNLKYGDHSISGLAGVAYEGSKFEVLGGSGKGLPLGLKVLNVVSNSQLVQGYTNEAYIQSFLSQVNYNYLGKYFLTGSFRVDGSSNFPPGNQYANFPSVSAAWIASNEDFFNIKNVVNYLKIRASYGVTGTQDIGASRYLGLYSLSAQYNAAVGAVPLQLPSPDLTWESKHQINLGVDLSLFNRVNLTVDAYHNVTKDLLLQVSQPLSVGFEQRWQNVGEIVNKGIEIGINSTNIKTRNFEWNTDFNINFNSNKLQSLPSEIIKTGSWAISQIYRNGGNLYEFYMPKWMGVNEQTGAPQWERVIKDGDGNVTGTELTSDYAQATFQEVGSALPKFQGGITNTFRYKNLALSFNAYFLYGNKVFSNNLRFVMNDGSEPYMNQIVLPSGYSIWTKPGDKATNPSPQNSANSTETSSRYLMDGSFLQLRNVTLSYSLPDSYVRKLKMEGITVSLSADNLHTFTDFVGQDPQTTITPGSFATPGVSDFKYPNNRQFLFNINFRF
ncbi:SusC/RagA family TonB-linked outer membrane protein [Pseudoflavitalea rhizosphaerae]|uniref:SusC/RagA family TonB-linked outer membrane protein n=1 Tax=Pseudoflavitalea rhizosphaerae TaxID=1884793 RepID=UPI001F49F5D8|nr:TonB-dependent receptor [Pseudoflavitalea rhizosphaerae]